ncbi:polysaccharide biosynthesis tyrosine autokinase [Aeromicrobium sp. Leaf350]|uniref:polysaccharide biosynthesis tyrosine autokinase n=1 Tax=Aeromicrobium sp. Leaf350 TaxID=2876565 RepID=UPI001E61321F|nr:polysaccharide biosynthesis tyrosine autokinase [Aeromicrobium sp. Leaf350]
MSSISTAPDQAPSSHFAQHHPGSGMRELGALLWRRRAIMLLVVLLVGTTVGIGLAVAERSYTATTRVTVTPSPSLEQTPASYESLLSTMADVAETRPVLADVSDAVGNRSVAQLQDGVRSAVVAGTLTIQVSVTDTDPEVAAQVANAVVTLLPRYDPSNGGFEFTVTEPASVPLSPSSPNISVTLLAGAVLAGVLAVIAAVVHDRVARTVETAEDVAEGTDVRVLGVVTRPDDATGVPVTDVTSREFASLRALRVALEFATSDEPTRSLVVAPVVPDPWSGWLEVNLAASLAELGHRVLLVDAHRGDLTRHPALEAPGEPGLYDLLAGTAELPDVVRSGPVDGVSVVPLGNIDLAAPSLLEMRFRQLVDQVDGDHDVILVHAPAVTESDDARIMAIAGSLLLTVPSGRVKRPVLERALADLRAVRIRVIGAVLLGAKAVTR